MKRFRYMLCILGLSGLFSAYQFDATAAKTYNDYRDCTEASYSGKYCKHRGANNKKCPAGCYCAGHKRTHTDPIDVTAICAGSAVANASEKLHMDEAQMYRCPDGYTSDQQQDEISDCYFIIASSGGNQKVYYEPQHLGSGKYLAFGIAQSYCSSTNLSGYYCPGGDYYPSPYHDPYPGMEPCLSGSQSVTADSRATCKITCAAGEYMVKNGNSVSCVACPIGYACSGGTLVVLGAGAVTSDPNKHKCTGNTFADVTGLPSCKPCNSPNVVYQQLSGKSSLLNVGCGDPDSAPIVGNYWAQQLCAAPKIRCQAGYYLKKNGTNTSYCKKCEAGYYCPGGCFGTTSPANNTEQGRNDCGAGRSSAEGAIGLAQCVQCAGNTYAPGPHSDSCQPCSLTQRVKNDHSGCEDCDPGYEQNSDNPTQCRAKTYTAYYDCGQHGTGDIPNGTAQYHQTFFPSPQAICTADTGWSFNGWKIGSTSCSPSCEWSWDGDRTLVAQWVAGPATQYTVTFNCGNGGTGNPNPGSVTVETGGTINTPNSSACTRANHSYTQWKSGNLILPAGGSYTWLGNADDTMTPDWVQNTNCSVTYMCNGTSVGTFTYTTSSFNVEEGCDDLPDGRTFKWWVDSNGTHTLAGGYYSCNGASAVTLTAEYNDAQVNPGSGGGATTYTITYNCIYGTNPNPQTGIESGDPVTVLSATACEKPNYHYTRWSSTSAGTFDVDEVVSSWTHGDQTLVPDWEPDSTQNPNATTYTITYNCLNGTSLDPETGIQNADNVTMPSAQACEKSGYHYTQWRSNYTGVGPFDVDDEVSWTYGNRTLYPDWVSDGNNGNGTGGGGNTTTTTVTSCSSGQYVPVGGTSCTTCPSGSFCPTAGTAVAGKSYSCFMGTPNSDRRTCRMVLDRDNMLHGLASGDDCWLKQMVDGPDGYKHCMFEGINQVQ